MMWNKKMLSIIFVSMIFLFIFFVAGLALSQSQVIKYNIDPIDKGYLENLRSQLNVGCLQNSQCSDGYECIDGNCIINEEVNSCRDISLAPVSRPLFIGQPLNMYREAFTETNLPHLLADGIIAVSENGNITEYNYAQIIFSGNSKLRSENGQVVLRASENPDDFFYKYRLYFSNDVDFSSRQIRGQVLRILGNEYIIGNDSTNLDLYLISNQRQIKLESNRRVMVGQNEISGANVQMIRGDTGVEVIEITFNKGGVERQTIGVGNSYADPVFNSSSISFNSYSDRASITIGGEC